VEKLYFIGFMYGMASAAMLILAYFGWWWANRRIRLADRFFGFLLILGAGAAVEPFCHLSIGWFALWTMGLPIVLSVWTLWLWISRRINFAGFRIGSFIIVCLTWACFGLIRFEGANADLKADLRWRWSPSSEELFLEERARVGESEMAATALVNWVPTIGLNDWTGFRGSDREGVIRSVTISTDWKAHPPQWRQRVGPAWSSMIVVGDRLFTQEQRGEMETVVCYEAASGKELWVHSDQARFWEAVSGAGPRATPTFANGRIYTLGGTGILNCLDAATGQKRWARDIRAEAEAKTPMWGYSNSPLVVDGKVIAFAGGEASLRAYQSESGDPAWTADAGPGSYSSPQLVTIAGQQQILMLSESGLSAFDPANGANLWRTGTPMPGAPRTLQPHLLDSHQLVVGTLEVFGVARVDITRDGGAWNVEKLWQSTQMKPEFPDFVVYQGHAYGFDGAIFACLDLADGKRSWKGGRYGRGQVVLLEEQGLLLVISESGEAILIAADPKESKELGKFQAVNGKTWNHPVISQGRLYVRNAEEMACYQLNN
jgi:outer membrane protein assembly factor BamB